MKKETPLRAPTTRLQSIIIVFHFLSLSFIFRYFLSFSVMFFFFLWCSKSSFFASIASRFPIEALLFFSLVHFFIFVFFFNFFPCFSFFPLFFFFFHSLFLCFPFVFLKKCFFLFAFCFSFFFSRVLEICGGTPDSLGKSAHSELALFALYWLVVTLPCGTVHILVMIRLRGGWVKSFVPESPD